MKLESHVPTGPLADKWDRHRFDMKLVNPANKRKYTVLVVGTGLAGASAAASLAELGYNVHTFCFQDSGLLRVTAELQPKSGAAPTRVEFDLRVEGALDDDQITDLKTGLPGIWLD